MRVPGRPPKDTSSATAAAPTASDSMSDLGDTPGLEDELGPFVKSNERAGYYWPKSQGSPRFYAKFEGSWMAIVTPELQRVHEEPPALDFITWLVDTGYGSDYTLKEPIPKSYRWPLAEEYSRRTIQDGKGYISAESPEHWYALLALALGWEASDE
jgi:hypothetical protein